MTGARTRDSRDCIVLKELAPSRISIKELSKRVWKEIDVDNVPGLAAQTSYYFVLALFPFLIFVAAFWEASLSPTSGTKS